MSLAGSAVVAIWNGITDAGRADFHEWHNREHIPERVSIAGFLRGRRYIALEGSPEYFTLYEVRDSAVLSGADYLARLNNPTRWSADSFRHFRDVARSLCQVDVTRGSGSGGWLGTLRFDCQQAQDPALLTRLTGAITDLTGRPGIVAGHVCRADIKASTVKTVEQQGRPDNAVPRWVVLIEGSTPEAVRRALSGPLAAAGLAEFGLSGATGGIYGLQFDLLAAA